MKRTSMDLLLLRARTSMDVLLLRAGTAKGSVPGELLSVVLT